MTDTQARYYDAVAETYDDFSGSTLHQAEDILLAKQLNALVASRRTSLKRLVDLACGTGLGYSLAHQFLPIDPNGDYHGFDISEGMLQVCRRKALTDGRFPMILRQGDINQLDPDDIPSDIDLALMGFGSFSYVESPVDFLRELARKLRPGNGHILVMAYSQLSRRNQSLACAHNDPLFLSAHRPYQFRDDTSGISAPSAHFYTHAALNRIALDSGFQHPRIVGMNFNTVDEDDCKSIDDAVSRLEHEMDSEPNPNDAHALIMSMKNY